MEGLGQMGFQLDQSNFRIITENHLAHWELVKQGLAIGVMPESIGDTEPKVVRILPDADGFDVDLWLVSHREVRTSRRIRRVFDFLADELR